MPGRNNAQLKNRYYSYIAKRLGAKAEKKPAELDLESFSNDCFLLEEPVRVVCGSDASDSENSAETCKSSNSSQEEISQTESNKSKCARYSDRQIY